MKTEHRDAKILEQMLEQVGLGRYCGTFALSKEARLHAEYEWLEAHEMDCEYAHRQPLEEGGSDPKCWRGRIEYDDVVDEIAALKSVMDVVESRLHHYGSAVDKGVPARPEFRAGRSNPDMAHPWLKAWHELKAISAHVKELYNVVTKPLEATDSERWAMACRYDGIEPDASFVAFSPHNPYSEPFRVSAPRTPSESTEGPEAILNPSPNKPQEDVPCE